MGFGKKWVRWMKRCVGYMRVSLLVNGSAGGEFTMELRQGCLLSPLLFNLVAESLSILVS